MPDPTPAQPQPSDDKDQGNIARSSHNVLVSNTGQASNGTTITGNNGGTQTKHAQKFTTGSNPTGYTLDEVRLYIGSAGNTSGPVITVNSGTGNNPGTVIYTLDNPGTFTSDTVNSFTATSGTTLDADTSYFVVMENTSTGGGGNQRYHVGTTLSNAEDSSGLSDWDIDNDGRTGTPNWGPTSSGVGYSIQVRGTANASNDATLSNLVLQDASDDSVLTLDPAFDSATLEYGATVGRGVGEITIIPTPNDTDADYEVQDGDGTALTDADTTQDEFQVSIARGLNAIQVEVTAEDTTTQTYTVTVTRPRILVSSTGQTSGGSTETGNRNGNQTKHAQKFTTGSNPAGYTLDEVRIYLGTNGNAAAPVITVNSGSGNNPGAVLYTMTNPATITDETTNTFTAPSGATLEADTNYFVVMENSNTNDDPNALYQVGITTSDGEDSSGLSDWSIDDTGRTGTPGWSGTSGNVAFRIQVRGTVDVDPNAAALPELSFDNINITVDEDGSQAALSVELSQASADTVTVDYATSDITAEAGDDYTETSGTLTFAPGETVKAIIVPILDDAIYETLERFNVTLSNPTGATLPTFPGAQINIAVDESPPTASMANVTVDEGAGTMTLTLNLSHESSRNTSYETTTSGVGGTATQGADYENFLSGGEARITVPAGDTQATLDIAITDDTAAESSETITIRWDNDPTGVSKGDATPATINFTGTITDNDSGVQLTIQDASADESNSSIFFTIDSSETLTQDVTFDYSTSIGASDSAEADDFDPASALSHTLEAGSVRGLIDIDLNDDNVYEGDETFTVTISNPVNASIADATATGTITDDETQPTLEVYETSATEGDDIVFLVDHAGPLTEDDVTFDYATSIKSDDTAETGDFTTTNGTGTITAGNTATIITVPTFDDGTNDPNSLYEGDETFTVTISNPTLAGISQATAKGTIIDDEDVPTASFRTGAQSTAENSGTINNFIQFDIAPLTEAFAQISLTITGTATAGQDYQTPGTTITVHPGRNQFSEPITISDDNVYELQEAVTVQLVAVSDNIQIDPTSDTKTLYILDNDPKPVLSFDNINIHFDETAGTAVLAVNKTGLTDVTARVDYATGQGVTPPRATQGEDYEATSGTLTFLPGETSKTILVTILDDNVYEQHQETFRVNLDNQSEAALPPATASATIRINSEDPVPTASMANVTASEPTGTMTLTLKLNRPSNNDISYRTSDNSEYRTGTATFEDDYEIQYDGAGTATITVLAGQLTGTFDITLIEDDLEEPDETIELRWQKRAASMATPDEINFVGTITDDADRPRGPTNLTATPDGANEIDLTWQAPTDIGTSDISGYKIQSSPNGTSNWTDLVANTYRTITNYSDSGLSPGTTRHYRIRAINASGAGSASNVVSATTADKTVSFGAATYTASENGATARVTVELSAAVDVIIPIRVQHRDGASSADYSGVPRRLIFEDGTTTRSFTVTAVDDSDNDDDEKIRIEFRDLPAVVGAGARSFTTVNLEDNDGGNSLPAFDPANELRNLVENTAANQNVGLPITATDADGDNLTYTFSGPDEDRFNFVPSTAQIRTKSGQTYDYETHQLFVVRVTADDGNGGTKTATVVIRVRNMAEQPSTPSRLTTMQVNPTSMVVSWTPPNNTGRPEIAGYDVQYRKSSETAWTPGPQAVADTNAALTGLEPSTTYYVQVRANNDEGDSPWTSTLSRSTRSLSPGIAITKTSVTVTEGNTTTYFIVLGSQPTTSVSVSLSGYGSTAVSISQNYHIFNTEDWNTPRAVTVTASEDADSRDKTVTIDHSVTTDDTDYAAITIPSLTVTIIDDDTPQVDGVSIQPGYEQLTVNWTAAPNATGYKLQWRRPGESYDTHTRLITITSGSTTTYTIPDLTNLSTYEVRVAATRTGQNDGPWSEEITGTPAAP